jgi:hypothetical protein
MSSLHFRETGFFYLFSGGGMMEVNKFKVARVLEGKKAIEIAHEARIPPSVYSLIENGWLIPKPEQLRRLERLLPKLRQAETLIG